MHLYSLEITTSHLTIYALEADFSESYSAIIRGYLPK